MRFLYTGASDFLREQSDPEQSIGGYVSKSTIPNRINNLFSDISYLSQSNESEECKGIVIENNSQTPISELFLGYSYDKNLYNIQIALVELTKDGKMEKLGNSKELPYYATFLEAFIDVNNSIDDSISIQNFEANSRYGIWIKRKIKQKLPIKCSELESINSETVDFNFIIRYNE
jgi:hypothetical protein